MLRNRCLRGIAALPMKERLDPLIDERAPWLARRNGGVRLLRHLLNRALGYDRTLALGTYIQDLSTREIMSIMGKLLAQDVSVRGLENIPRHGPVLLVANHPTGIADGIILDHVLRDYRPDAFYYANSDILRVLPQLSDAIIPVEWRHSKRNHSKMRLTMARTRAAIDAGRLGVIFPAGRLAKRKGLQLHEREWMPSAAMIARKFELSVIPVHIQARNSALFYLFDFIHPTLRDITLFHETLNKSRQPFRITIGEPISPASFPATSEAGISLFRRTTLALGGRYAPTVSLVESTRRPLWL